MDRNAKFLKKLSKTELRAIESVLAQLLARNISGLDIKKLRGYKDVYRVRTGNIRIVFQDTTENIAILLISRRSEKTYKEF